MLKGVRCGGAGWNVSGVTFFFSFCFSRCRPFFFLRKEENDFYINDLIENAPLFFFLDRCPSAHLCAPMTSGEDDDDQGVLYETHDVTL